MAIRPCPICERPALARHMPFCSAVCKDEDLRRWLAGEYRIPASADADTDDEDGTPRDEKERS